MEEGKKGGGGGGEIHFSFVEEKGRAKKREKRKNTRLRLKGEKWVEEGGG